MGSIDTGDGDGDGDGYGYGDWTKAGAIKMEDKK